MSRVPIAIAHDYLTQRGGAERVVLALARAYPSAPIYTTLYEPGSTYPEFRDLDIRTSWLNGFAAARRHHRAALPLLPLASRSMDIDADVVIASSSGWAHGFPTTGRRLVYCYSPARWLYEPERYLGSSSSRAARWGLGVLAPSLKRWDQRAAQRADAYLAISSVTQDRIRRTYARESVIVPAPHSVELRAGDEPSVPIAEPGYFLVVSRLLPYKNVREIMLAFADRSDQRLVIVGTGPDKAALRAEATPNVSFLENLTEAEMASCYAGCRALIAASHEDFGLTPLEAAAHGKPSAVLRWGGFLDTVVEGSTGVFFDAPEPRLIAEALDVLVSRSWSADELRARAALFDESHFAAQIKLQVDQLTADAQPDFRKVNKS